MQAIGAASPNTYSSTMTGNETFIQDYGFEKSHFLTPDADRNFDPSGVFTIGYRVWVINCSVSYNIIFDSSASIQPISPGTYGLFIYDGSIWR